MQAVIMAGGKGTRMNSIIKDAPKTLLPLNKELLIDYIIYQLKKGGFDNIIICAGYLGRRIEEYTSRKNYGIPVRVLIEKKPLGTGGALSSIKKLLNNTFLVFYGDIFTTMDISKLVNSHMSSGADCTLVVKKSDHPKDSNLVSLNSDRSVKKFYFKPHKNFNLPQYGISAIYLFEPEVLQLLPKMTSFDLEKDFFPILLKTKKKLVGYVTREFIKDIGTPERYNMILSLFKE